MKLGQLLTATLMAAAAMSQAQLPAAKTLMGDVLTDLGSEPVYSLYKSGTEDINGTITNIDSGLIVRDVSTNPGEVHYRIEYVARRNGVYTHRGVVDGSRIWFYTVATNSYSTYTYNQLNVADQPATIFRTLRKFISGEDQFLVQLAQEAYEARISGSAAAANKWLPWMPMYSSLVVSSGVIEAVSQVPNYRYLAYETSSLAGVDILSRIVGRTEKIRGATTTINDWNINAYKYELASANYTFVPPAGSRATASGLAQGG
ncbi:hypothetical protein CCB80_00855 [Armatimonadetes bacterium Uphvl-Ar1]|nr:hypothetical protein CCB80_00855 [Armatimonadetes bacterium Uphvl-Ar1]